MYNTFYINCYKELSLLDIFLQVGIHGAISRYTGVANPRTAAMQCYANMGVLTIITKVATYAGAYMPESNPLSLLDQNQSSAMRTNMMAAGIGAAGAGVGATVFASIAGMYISKKVCEYYELPISDTEIFKLEAMSAVASFILTSCYNRF